MLLPTVPQRLLLQSLSFTRSLSNNQQRTVHELCMNCACVIEKKLEFVNNQTCSRCHDVALCAMHPNCIKPGDSHKFCMVCMQQMFWGLGWDVDPTDYGFMLEVPKNDASDKEQDNYDQAFELWCDTKQGKAYNLELDIEEQERWASQTRECVACVNHGHANT